MKKSCVILLSILVSVFAVVGFAQQNERQSQLASLVQAERDFARAASAKGMQEAFLSFAADDGIVFRRTAVNAKQVWGQGPPPTGLLAWQPVYADVSRAGDLGYTTGPYEFREKADEEKPEGQGNYVTIWRRQPDGSWKFVLDFGTRNPPTTAPAPALRFAADNRQGGDKAKADVASGRAELLKMEREFGLAATARGTVKAYLAYLADDARLYRQNAFPLTASEPIRAALSTPKGIFSWQPARTDVSLSGDLGYAYGTYELRESRTESKPVEQGNYMRIWKRRANDKWRVVLEVMVPVKPPATT